MAGYLGNLTLFLSLISLYYVSVKKLNFIKNIEHLYQSEKIEDASASAQVSRF